MKNNVESGESAQMSQQQEIGFQQPPPYQEYSSYPNWAPNNGFNNTNNSTLDLFSQALGSNESFILAPIGRFGFTTRTIIVQLQDISQRPLLSIMTLPGQNVPTGGHNGGSIRIGSVINMNNSFGQTLLTAKENGQSMTVSSGEQVLGVVEGNLLCSTNLNVRGVMGESLFQSIGGTEMNASSSGGCCGSTPSEFTLLSRGVALARIQRPINNSGGCVVSLINSQNIDLRTKALLIFTGYFMYYAFFADTTFGKIGARGFAKRLCMYICIIFLIIMVLFTLIPIIVMTT
ncbi:hypothetical protein Bhyg_02350 [Pseudolycoriella hygida]|uniref:Uncharacterized protein n=1 Tax=Pseudolycoriella hygida TaxID=35572 RepID=A0A9Q0NB79_9DIPT|nr:hypothetical protein Bhyg_02350 [Pseudolycoriella hygida]